jgi:tRNA N6-adenosine threonylcarbamoyltransferase
MVIALGLEGSANKIGIGIVKNDEILSNVRHTFTPPPGKGFLPKETAAHHRAHIHSLLRLAFSEAKMNYEDIDCICFTKGTCSHCLTTTCNHLDTCFCRAWNGWTSSKCCCCCKNTSFTLE